MQQQQQLLVVVADMYNHIFLVVYVLLFLRVAHFSRFSLRVCRKACVPNSKKGELRTKLALSSHHLLG